jgi:WD repeat-containing protein 35
MGGETLAGATGFGGGGAAGGGGGTGGGGARTFDAAWHGAEACHWLLLAQRLLYAGAVDDAMVVAQRLQLFEDVLDPCDVYSVMALTAYYAAHLALASRALIRLEHLDSLSREQQERYADVAFAIFARGAPADPPERAGGSTPCAQAGCAGRPSRLDLRCQSCNTANSLCVVSGKPLGGAQLWTCATCHHKALTSAMAGRVSCALCHAPASGAS